jgi:hypothetical protein
MCPKPVPLKAIAPVDVNRLGGAFFLGTRRFDDFHTQPDAYAPAAAGPCPAGGCALASKSIG